MRILLTGDRRTGARHSSGFTLIELLISITILGLVLGVVYNAFYTCVMVNKKLKHREKMAAGVKSFFITITRNLKMGLDIPANRTVLGKNSRNTDSLEVIHLLRQTVPFGMKKKNSVVKTRYYLKKAGLKRGYTLLKTDEKFEDMNKIVSGFHLTLPDSEKENNPDEILRNVDSLNFRFYDGKIWRDNWNSDKERPRAVEVKLVLLDTKEKNKTISYNRLIYVKKYQ